MPRRVGPVKVRQYSLEFKLKAVKLSQLEGVEVQAVADALEIHPFIAVAERSRRWGPPRAGVGRQGDQAAVGARDEAVPDAQASACVRGKASVVLTEPCGNSGGVVAHYPSRVSVSR